MRVPPAENPLSRPSPAWVAPAILAAAVVACYGNSLSGPLVLDDSSTIANNPTRSNWSQALHPPTNSALGGRPFANLTFVLNRALGGAGVESYHAGNLLIHLGAALAFFGICRRRRSSRTKSDAGLRRRVPRRGAPGAPTKTLHGVHASIRRNRAGTPLVRARYGRTSRTRLNGVSAARRKRVKPPSCTTARNRPSPACAPSASPRSCARDAGVQIMVEAA